MLDEREYERDRKEKSERDRKEKRDGSRRKKEKAKVVFMGDASRLRWAPRLCVMVDLQSFAPPCPFLRQAAYPLPHAGPPPLEKQGDDTTSSSGSIGNVGQELHHSAPVLRDTRDLYTITYG